MKNLLLFCFRKVIILLLLFTLSKSFLHAQNAADPDTTFIIGTGTDYEIETLAIQNDGKIILGGGFTTYNGTTKNGIARLNTDGSLDATFNVGGTGANGSIASTAIQSDGKIIISGGFMSYNGTARKCIARLNADGSLDATFNVGSGTDEAIQTTAIQSDGKIIIGGCFANYNGTPLNKIARLNVDGSLDTSFNIGTGTGVNNYCINTVTIQNNGKIIIGGYFSTYNGTAINNIARLNTDGSLDTSFNIGTGPNSEVETIAIQTDGKIIVAGDFTSYNGTARNHIARLNSDGSLDTTFNVGSGTNSYVWTTLIQSDGKIIIGGFFTSYNGLATNYIARLNSNGSLDASFNVGIWPNTFVETTAIQSDGKIIIAGQFSTYNGKTYNNIVRVQGVTYSNTIEGNIFTDGNNDCILQPSEKPISSLIVKALPGPYYGSPDNSGHYILNVDSGSVSYTLTQEHNSINSKLWVNQCSSSQTISLTGATKDTCCFNFADSVGQCFILDINIQKSSARQCIKGNTYINYTNYGNSIATGAVVKIEYPSHIFPVASTPMWSSIQDSMVTYNIGTVQAGQSGQIIITDSVDCGVDLSHQVECIKATISPASNCVPDNPAWDKSSMKVTGTCTSGSAHFNITNDGTGNMGSSLQYRVFVNDTLVYTGNYKLNSGQSFTIDYPAAGQSIRVEADQSLLHPGNNLPRATVKNCGTAISGTATTGLVTTAPLDDLDEEVAITCPFITNSHDPNEKQAFPSGIGASHNVTPGEEIEYVIHFQNTGTDTAYTVTVVDTLDARLDVASFTQGASSNPYTLGISGKGQAVLTFRFNNINLPDSTTNNLASSGLVSYRMTVPSSAAIGTVIKNKAYIFFDYNAPVITNETMHTVDTITYKDLSKGSAVQVGSVVTGLTGKKFIQAAKIYPNPSAGIITVEMPETGNNSELRIMSLVGALQKSVPLSSAIQEVSLDGLNQGMYIYEVWQNGERKAGGKLQVWF
jgi:uncharacterized delta-60 repeat protein/uncharacterized repeat protein (TIGR01451 family)